MDIFEKWLAATEAAKNNNEPHDNWGSCCSGCPYWGQPHKPCCACERSK